MAKTADTVLDNSPADVPSDTVSGPTPVIEPMCDIERFVMQILEDGRNSLAESRMAFYQRYIGTDPYARPITTWHQLWQTFLTAPMEQSNAG